MGVSLDAEDSQFSLFTLLQARMSDYVPTESESDRDTSDNHHSPAPRTNHRTPLQTQTQPSQTGPIRGSSQRRGHHPVRSVPPLRGSVAAAAAAARESRRPTAASPQTARPTRAALIPSTAAAQTPAPLAALPSEELPDPGEVRVTAFSGIPDSVIDMTHLDEPIDDEFVQELEVLFELRRGYAHAGESLAYVAPPRQYAVHLYSQLAILQAIDRTRSIVTPVPDVLPAPEVAPADQARSFMYAPVFKGFVKRRARELLMTKNLKVYGSDPPRGAPATLKSLLVLVLDYINEQSANFKRDYLPRGYADGHPGAVSSVDSFVRVQLRKSRGTMRDLLLTNIQAPTGREITHPIPTITALMVYVGQSGRWMVINNVSLLTLHQLLFDSQMRNSLTPPLPNSTAVVAGDTQEARGNQTHLKARLAYLRILTIMQLVGRGPRDAGRQWRNIDEHLRELDAMGRDYRTAFFRLILRLDRNLFDGSRFFVGMDTTPVKLPTTQEVETLMAATGDNAEADDAMVAEV
ncbi:hypothetical protein PGTUg99_014779 [Puccinia graminis f. sp. tritici]|uniref:Uncharacterized protein n=1 Tax=Puccinia graminis f. sp. tritici TaxID=56615 RepID=A0A5B0RZB6_PUCGR|nr:hypothetical protein PGTUg99_014779 [Puccinia graminis f. sp. tritici]